VSLQRYQVTLSVAARAELADLHAYVAERAGLGTADRLVDRLERACWSLETAPHRGTLLEELGSGIRSMGYKKRATIVFRVDDNMRQVVVVAVLYGGRDIAKAMEEREA
jgi:plasmid stabilization system protein ParE